MRKQNKIVSLILVLALLLGVFAVLPTNRVVASAAGEPVTPSASVVEGTAASGTVGTAEGNLAKDGGILTNFNTEVIAYYTVTPEDTKNPFGLIVAKADKTTANHYVNVNASKSVFNFDTGYYVIEADIATESVGINFTLKPLITHDGSTSWTTRLDPTTEALGQRVTPDGNWHRYTLVGDLAANKLYIFVDGVRVDDGTKVAYAASNKTNDRQYYIGGIRVDIGSPIAMTVGATLAFDNIDIRVFDSNEGLNSAIAAGDLTDWSGYKAAGAAELPAIAKSGDKTYNSQAELNELFTGFDKVEVELLRNSFARATVNRNAVVETNGYANSLSAGEGVVLTTDGTVNTYVAPSVTEVKKPTMSQVGSSIAVSGKGNVLLGNGTNLWKDATFMSYLVTDKVTGNTYFDMRVGESYDASATVEHNWFPISAGANVTYQKDTVALVGLDVFVDSDILSNLYFGFISRDSSGGAKYATGSFKIHQFESFFTEGAWNRVYFVGDVNNNVLYIYVNGVLAHTASGGLYNGSFVEGYYFENIRVQMNERDRTVPGQNFAIDNVFFDITSKDSWLLSNFGAANLNGWTNAPTHELPAAPVLALVDGEEVGSVVELNSILTGNGTVSVELVRKPQGTITVNRDSVIKTNGFAVPVAGSGTSLVSSENNVYTFNAPYTQSGSFVDEQNNNNIVSSIKSSVNGNLFTSIANNITTAYGVQSQIVTNNIYGGNYLQVTNVDPSLSNNTFLELYSFTTMTPNANTQYYVFDVDFALLSDSTVAFFPTPREGASGSWGGIWLAEAKKVNFNTMLAGKPMGEMQHVTVVFDVDANVAYYFVNGAIVATMTEGCMPSTDHGKYWLGTTQGTTPKIRFNGVRIGSSLGANGGYALDNALLRTVEVAPSGYAADSLTAAVNAGDLSLWADAVTEVTTKTAPLAKVDGEYVYSASALNSALSTGRRQKTVELLRDETTAVTVNTSAIIETNGLKVTLNNGAGVTSTTAGTVKTFVAPWLPSTTETSVSDAKFAVGTHIPENLFATATGGMGFMKNDGGELAMYKVTDNETGNTYVKIVSTKTGNTSDNVYLTTEIISAKDGETSATNVLPKNTGYYVFDLDIATDSEMFAKMTLEPVARNNASESSTFPFPTGVAFNSYFTPEENWTHITVVEDMAANKQYYFINGVLSGIDAGVANKENNYDYIEVKGFRLNLGNGVAISTDESILVDNISCRVYKSNEASGNIAAAITAGSLADWSKNVYEGASKLPSIATVNGTEYSSVESLTQALDGKKNLTVSLDRVPYGAAVAMASSGTIITNGLSNFIAGVMGYNVTDNGDGTYTVKFELKFGTLVVTVNGSEAIRATLEYGTDIVEYLNSNNAYFGNVIASDSGAVYTGAQWDVQPGGVIRSDEHRYAVTDATRFEGDFLALDSSGAVASFDSLDKAINATGEYNVVLNSDITLAGQVTLQGTKDVYLAGHTLTFPTSGARGHAMQAASSANSISFIGGQILDNVRANTQSVVFCNYDFAGEIKFKNVDIYAVANISSIRGGTVTLEDCELNMLESYRSQAFLIGEYYNTACSGNKCVVNLIDTNVRFNYFKYQNSNTSLIVVKGINDWTFDPSSVTEEQVQAAKDAASAAGKDKIVHEVNISGCTVGMDFGSSLIKGTNEYAKINIDNTQLNVKSLIAAGTTTPVTFGENVLSAVSIKDIGSFPEGYVEVKSGVPGVPYAYTDEYATVTWSDGTTEKWADGAYPVNPDCMNDIIGQVEAGQSITFEEKTVDLGIKANVTLNTNLIFNLYIPTTYAIKSVNIGGVEYGLTTLASAQGVECYHFEYELAPYRAAAHFTMVVTLENGDTVARDISFVEYADKVLEAYADNALATNLVKAILNYVALAHESMGVYMESYEAVKNYADPEATTVSDAVNEIGEINSYITSASLDLNAAPKWIFKLAVGADISNLQITVGGNNVEYVVEGGRIVVELPAYDMLDTIVFSVDGVNGQYNFAAYYEYMQSCKEGFANGGTANGDNAGAEAYFYMDLLDAFYTYAKAAEAYKG